MTRTDSNTSDKMTVILSYDEMSALRKAIIQKFFLKAKDITPEMLTKSLNSNLNNYVELINDIDKRSTIGKIGDSRKSLQGAKPLATLFHFKKNELFVRFNKQFINVLYDYAFGITRENYSKGITTSDSIKSRSKLDTFRGCWVGYYDRDGNFSTQFQTNKNYKLGRVLYWIDGTSMEDAYVLYGQKKFSGRGKVYSKAPNLFLKSEIGEQEQYLAINYGIQDDSLPVHFEYLIGTVSYLDNSDSPKTSLSILVFDKSVTSIDEFKKKQSEFEGYIEFNEEKFKSEQDFQTVFSYYYGNETNMIIANHTLFKDTIRKALLLNKVNSITR